MQHSTFYGSDGANAGNCVEAPAFNAWGTSPRWRVKHPPMTAEQQAQYDIDFKASCDAIYAKMTPAERRRTHEQAVAMGISQPERRSPLDILIDRAVGRD